MTCNQQYYLWGDPNGRSIPRSAYVSELEKYQRLIKELRGKRLVRLALGWCSKYLQKAQEGSHLFNPDGYMTKLAEAGLEPEEMLLEALAIYDYCIRHHKPSSKHQIGNALLRLHRWPGKRGLQGKHRRIIGEYVLNNLKPFFDHMIAYETQDEMFHRLMKEAIKERKEEQLDTE